ncbi:sulfotransferase [Mesorhizobium sp. KR9-304]|uniref:sulfotransferase n=1 Tax=Mesorhizobium sp. KR9-304 TaxID=3156614 RepID=UPI0032B4D7BD
MVAYLSNKLRQRKSPDVKIFFIGFNRCGTNSFHQLMTGSGIRSVHWLSPQKENITDGIEARLGDLEALREYLSPWTAFSDMISASETRFVEGNSFFPALHEAFPRAYFVLNDRDVEAWLRSRVQHSKGTFLQRAMAYHATDKDGVLDIWRRQHAEHTAKVLGHFAGNPRFIHFRIDRDPIEQMVDFLAPDFKVSASDWQVHKKSKASA